MKLIKIKEEHYVIVDDSKTKEGDFIADFRLDCRILISKWNEEDSIDGFFFDAKKITHSTQPLEPIVTDNSFKNYEFISLQEVKEIISEMPNGNKIDLMAEKHNFGELECQVFEPEKLIGKSIYFRCVYCEKPTIMNILSVKKHHQATNRSWTYIGRADLVVYETDNGDFSMDYTQIIGLIEKGEYIKDYELKIVKTEK